MGNFHILDILLLLGIGQGFFLSITLPILHNNNIAANKILSLQLLVSCVVLLTRMAIYKAEALWIIQRLAPLEALIFVFGPLGYSYLKRLLEREQAHFRLSWIHYFPALIYLGFLAYLNTYSTEEFGKKLIAGGFSTLFFRAELSAILFNWWYWWLSTRFFLTILKKEKEQLSFQQTSLLFIQVLLLTSGLVLLAWTVSFLSTHVFNVLLPVLNYNLVWITIPLLIYVVGFFALKQPEIFRIMVKEKSKIRSRELLKPKEVSVLKKELNQVMEKEKIYLDNELTLAGLAKRLNTSTNNLSWLLNTVYQSNFYDFINGYRIREFVYKLEREEHKVKTIFSLSLEVGFNSKSTFNKAFKTELKQTPSNYIKNLVI
ncbi:MAG: AraC family transcriptional regulator [Bacteroidota bacterium]